MNFKSDELPLYLGKPLETLEVNAELLADKGNAYAMTIEDDSLAPMFRAGDVVLVDPDKKATPGDYVIIGKKGWNSEAAILVNAGEYLTVRNATQTAPFTSLGTTIIGVIIRALSENEYRRVSNDR